jgi:hypothetical protein
MNVRSSWTPSRALCTWLGVAFAALAAVSLVTESPASPVTGTAGPATVSVSAVDGQSVTIHAEATGGAQLFEIRAHVCRPGSAIGNFVDFGYQGPYCVAQGGIQQGGLDGDYETFVVPDNQQSGDLTFHAGTGTVGWLDESGWPHTLTCGPGSPCDLVVQLQVTNATTYYAAPLCFGDCPTDPGAEPVVLPIAASQNPEPPPVTGDLGEAAPVPAQATNSPSPAPGEVSQAESKSASGSGSGEGSPVERTVGSSHQQASLVIESDGMPSGVRVFAAEAAGVVGGVLIVMIVLRARRRMALESAQVRFASGSVH